MCECYLLWLASFNILTSSLGTDSLAPNLSKFSVKQTSSMLPGDITSV